MRSRLSLFFLFVWLGGACGGDGAAPLEVYVTAEHRAAVDRFVEYLPYQPARVIEDPDPLAAASAGDDRALRIALLPTDELGCSECYRFRLAGSAGAYLVEGADLLGVQYGLAHMLETSGFRFYHPLVAVAPERLEGPATHEDFDVVHEPEMSLRGLHLHTLHPIEGYYAFWEPEDQNLDDSRRIIDWIVKNRGNYVQWVALDDIQRSEVAAAAWNEHTEEIIAEANERGVQTGLGIQLFGSGNLQQAFDLLDEDETDPRAALEERLPQVLDLPLDIVNLSFGEFFGEDPEVFVETLDLTYEVISELRPDITVTATIHVGDSPDQRVEYMGEDMIYYFLVKFADPGIVPVVHTVMFYNLFEDAGGAYHHDDFSEHREYLLERLDAGERVIYYPETAYWVAFDNSVPIYLPLYVRSRWLDVVELRAAADPAGVGKLDEHVIFSTGWEWGYWQNDYATLRDSFTAKDDWRDHFHHMYEIYGERGARLADAIVAFTELQHEYLLERRLMAYLAGRDFYIDLGDEIDIVSQPDRPQFDEVAEMSEAERQAFADEVLDDLQELATGTEAVLADIDAIGGDDPWFQEVRDGVSSTLLRIRFIHAIYRAVVAHADGADAVTWLDEAETILDEGREVVAGRHGALHSHRPERLTAPTTNATLYQFGYLEKADTLCYWRRERIQARKMILDASTAVPACVF